MPHRASPSASWRLRRHRYGLLGSKCNDCTMLFYPPKEYCTKCKKSVKTKVRLSGFGKIETFTTIHHPPAGFEESAPYVVAIIKLDEGPMVAAQIINLPEECKIGSKVGVVFRKLYKDSDHGLNFYGTKFQVIK